MVDIMINKLKYIIFLLLIIIPTYSYANISSPIFRQMIGLKINECEIIDIRYVQETQGSREKYAFVCIGKNINDEWELREYRFYNLVYETDLDANHVFHLIHGDNIIVNRKKWEYEYEN